MKRVIGIVCALSLFVCASVPALAEDQGKPVLVDWRYYKNETKDEEYADKLYNAGRELTAEEFDPNQTAPPPPGYNPPTPEEIEANKTRQAQYEREQNEKAWDDCVRYEKEQRDAMMRLVFQDYLDEMKAPEDSFNGDYAEYKNKDGSVTKVYDNGSVSTKYSDGTAEAFDTWGNHYTADRDGNETIHLTDGNTLTGTADSDYYTWHGQDGSSFTPDEQGGGTWKNKSGIVIAYSADGERTAIGFENGDMMRLWDGMFPQGDGEFKGPGGATIEWHNGTQYLGDGGYSFRIVGEDGRSGQAKCDPNFDYRVDEDATREKKLETNGAYKDYIMTSDTKTEISSFNGNAWEIVINNYDPEVNSVTFEDWDGNVYTDKYFKGGGFQKSYESADGSERYQVSLDDRGLNAFYRDKDGEHNLIKTSLDEDGNVVLTYEDGGTFVINDKQGVSEYTGPDGTKILVTRDSDDELVEYANPEKGVFYTEKNGVITSGTGPIGDGLTLNIKDGEMEIVTPAGEKIKVTEYADGSRSATLPDGSELTKDPDGNWLRDGKPMSDPFETQDPEETDPPTETATTQTETSSDKWGHLTPQDVAGTYSLGGSGLKTEYIDLGETTFKDQVSVSDLRVTLTVRAVKGDRIAVNASGDVSFSGEYALEPSGKVQLNLSGVSLSFLPMNGGINAAIFWDTEELYAGFTGMRN
jgi:hypothetical protein